ncbi:MAG: hypothetical protein HQ511_02090 [Rhodospirillales bacterium]|nr:hypothetical protein [Rhodospirillales bacterium]
MSLKALIWFVFLGFMAIAGAMAAATDAEAQGLAECSTLSECSLSSTAITNSNSIINETGPQELLNAQYGTVGKITPVNDQKLPHQGQDLDAPMVAKANTGPIFVSYWRLGQVYVDGTDIAAAPGEAISLWLSMPTAVTASAALEAFSYNFSDRWRFRADALDDNSIALQAIAAGNVRDPEDLLWHLSESDFSVNLGLVRSF